MTRSHFCITFADMGTTSTTHRVAANVRAELAARRLRGSDLADALGVSHSTMYRRLAGDSAWPVDVVEAAAAFLDVPVLSLFVERAA